MRFTERQQRYGGISRIKRGERPSGRSFCLGEAERGEEGQGVLRGAGSNSRVRGF